MRDVGNCISRYGEPVATIAIVHFGLRGHVAPANRLSRVLAAEGHQVIAWAPETYRELIESSGVEHRYCNPVPQGSRREGVPGFQARLIEGAQRHVGTLVEELLAERVDLVIHDCYALWGQVAAEFLGLPRIVSYPLFRFTPRANGRWQGSQAPDWGATLERAQLYRRLIEREWGIDVGGWEGGKASPGELTVNYTIEEIVGPSGAQTGWEFVGPLLEERPPQPRTDPPLVYVCLGTFWTFRRDVYRAAIDALADEPVTVVVSTGRGPVTPARLQPLPTNVTVFDFVDARDILSRAQVHITHGGIGSVHESLLAGVPMVCLPQGIDQFAWAQHAARLGVGERTEPTPEAIRAAVSRLLSDDKPRAAAQALGQKLARYDGAARLMKCVERTLTGSEQTAF
jgi:MGT family glycosyltransferase